MQLNQKNRDRLFKLLKLTWISASKQPNMSTKDWNLFEMFWWCCVERYSDVIGYSRARSRLRDPNNLKRFQDVAFRSIATMSIGRLNYTPLAKCMAEDPSFDPYWYLNMKYVGEPSVDIPDSSISPALAYLVDADKDTMVLAELISRQAVSIDIGCSVLTTIPSVKRNDALIHLQILRNFSDKVDTVDFFSLRFYLKLWFRRSSRFAAISAGAWCSDQC